MTPYMKRFIYASLAYLAIGSMFSTLNSVPGFEYMAKYTHTHFNLAGFMSMMVFGIGYFILPRFNGSDLRFPGWIGVHFWIGNVSLIGMVASRAVVLQWDTIAAHAVFGIFATVQLVSILMFVVNIWMTLAAKPVPAQQSQSRPAPQPTPTTPKVVLQQAGPVKPMTVSANSRVSDLVDAAPSVKQLLVTSGLSSLALPGHIDKVRAMGITLGMACRNHGLDLEGLVEQITQDLRANGVPVATPSNPITADAMIGEVLQNYPEARAVFQRHFGSGCFDCPGQAFESVSMACKMHNVDEQQFLRELGAAVA